jgi:hypothetical protein
VRAPASNHNTATAIHDEIMQTCYKIINSKNQHGAQHFVFTVDTKTESIKKAHYQIVNIIEN